MTLFPSCLQFGQLCGGYIRVEISPLRNLGHRCHADHSTGANPWRPVAIHMSWLYRQVRHLVYVGWLFVFWSTPTTF